jgi:hypothetical protein
MAGKPERCELLTRWGQLKNERSSWVPHWQEVSNFLLPRSGRFFTSDRNRGERRHNNIYDSTGTRALRVLAAGMMAGMTSPARPWFRLSTSDQELNRVASVKVWLDDVQRLMLRIFASGNTYRALHSTYEELGAFGTGASIMLPDFNDVVRHYPLTAGEYCIGADYRGQVNTLYREFDMTISQVVGQFGYKNCSLTVRNLFDRGQLDSWVTVIHAVEPRADRDTRYKDAKNMAWRSTYFEIGADKDKYLKDSGFKEFVALCPRWGTAGGDIYGNGPGMEALGDIKQLQHEQLRKGQVIDLKTKPPLQIPGAMKNRELDMLPGGVSYVDMTGQNVGIRTAYEVNLDLSHLLGDIQDVRQRIESSFYADLFLMLSQDRTGQMTATEVAERHEEKLTMLGPVVERLQNELLDPLVEGTFARALEAGIIPPPPEEMQGQELNVEFVSMLAQAQQAVGVNSIDRFVNGLGVIAQFKPGALDKFDEDAWADIYSDNLGVDPKLIVANEKVALIRQQKAQAAQQAQQAAMLQQGADTAKSLAAAKTDTPSALTNVIDMFSGYNT